MSNVTPQFDSVEFTTTVTAEMLQAAEPVLAQASILQNLAFKDRSERATYVKRSTLFTIITILLLAISALTFLLSTYGPKERQLFWGSAGFISLALFLFCWLVGHRRIDGALQRFVERMFRRKAKKSIARTALQAPFDVKYHIDECSYQASIEKVELNRSIDCKKVGAAYFANNVYCLFKKSTSHNWCGIVYTTNDEQRQAFDRLFERAGVEVRDIKTAAMS